MPTLLFVTWDGGGNVAPALEIARALVQRGDRVRFLGQPSQRATIRGAGFDFESYRNPGAWTATKDGGGAQSAKAFLGVLTNRGFGEDVLASVERTATDIVVIDCLLYGPLKAAEKAGLRRAVLMHSLYGAVSRTMASGPAGAIARIAGYHPRHMWAAADLVLVTTLKALDLAPLRADAAVSLTYTGPALPDGLQLPQPGGPPPTVLVSLSTTFIPGQERIVQAVLDGVGELPVHGLVTTGPAVDPDRLRVPENTQIHTYLPHPDVMPTSSVLVGHGGHATTMLALAHDLPLVIIPVNRKFDQPIIGKAAQDAGAGILLPTSASPERIRGAIATVLADDRYRTEAARLGAAIRASRGTATAADRLHSLASVLA
jgi:UDP:flavonoid glycosyltransferase YjiC (YdhE family)